MLAQANALEHALTATLDYSAFKKAVLNACRIVDKRNTIPVLSTLLIRTARNGAIVSGTDLDIYTTTFVSGEVSDGFACIVDAHKLKAMMDKVKDARVITFSQTDERLVATIGKLKLSLTQDIDLDQYPEDAGYRSDLKTTNVNFLLPSAQLATILSKIEFAISTEETRYYLNGVYIHVDENRKKMAFVATDGHRLARYEIAMPEGSEAMQEDGAIVPRKTIAELSRLVARKDCPPDLSISVSKMGIAFSIGHEEEILESKLVDGTFPDYARVIPTCNEHTINVFTADFINGIKQASAISSQRGTKITLKTGDGSLIISSKDADFGTASTDIVAFHDADIEMAFNGGYVLDVLARIDGKTTIMVHDAASPALFKDTLDTDATFVIMPQQI